MIKIALAGNPNSGKTTLYNLITGRQERIGNWSGITVEKKEAKLKDKYKKDAIVIDLPGVYSLSSFTSEESIAINFVKEQQIDVLINVIDSNNLSRSLYLSSQLLELGIPMIIALNKSDLAKYRIKFDLDKLSKLLNCPVVIISSANDKGVKELIKKTIQRSEQKEQINLFEDLNDSSEGELQDKIRYDKINQIVSSVETRKDNKQVSISDKIDYYLTNPFIGLTVFFFIMWGIFELSINWLSEIIANILGGIMSFFSVTTFFQDAISDLLTKFGVSEFFINLINHGIIGGAAAVLGFIPLIMSLMFCLSLLEDCGFMARIAFILDPLFKKIGLNGKSIVSLAMGYGCSVPGIMATRTIKSERQKRMTVLLTPFIPCGAKVPIIVLFTVAFFPDQGWMFPLVYLMSFLLIIVLGLFIKNIVGAENIENYFIIELPEYKYPSFSIASSVAMDNCKSFIKKAGTIIVIASMIVFLLSSFDFKLNLITDNIDESILATIALPISFLLIPLGFGVWQLAAAAITGFVAKEEVIGTIAVLYAVGGLVNENFEVLNSDLLRDTLGITKVAALAFMFFNLFTPPCFAAIGAMRSELKSKKWLAFGILLQFCVGYLFALIVYQVGTLIVNGKPDPTFIIAIIILVTAVLISIRMTNKNKEMEMKL